MSETREVSAGPTERFPVDELILATVGGREIGILRRDDGTVHAVRNWCPHKGAPICKVQPTGTAIPGPPGTLAWGHEGEILRCPWHGYEFNIKTGARPYTDSAMTLRVYPARISAGEVLVDLGPRRSSASKSERS